MTSPFRAYACLMFLFSLSLTLCTGRAAMGDPLPAGSVAGDFNGDGRMDVLVQPADGTHPGQIVLQDGTGALSVQVQVIDASFLGLDWVRSDAIAYTGDFDGDGRADVLLQSKQSGGVQAILLSDPTSELTQIEQKIPANYMGLDWSAATHRLVIGDFNGDGHSDVLLQSVNSNDVNLIVSANAQGQLNTTGQGWMDGYLGREWSTQDVQIYTGDFNGDGKTDLLLQTRSGQETNGQSAYALILADDQGRFTQVAQTWNTKDLGADWSPATHTLAVRDINGDGIADIVLTSSDGQGSNYALLGNSTGVFDKPAVTWKGNESAEVALQSLSGQGQASVTVTGASTTTSPKTATMMTAATTSTTTTLTTNFATATAVGTMPGSGGVNGGAATYSIPIAVPPGRAGMQPAVSLSYSSRGGNGTLGMGWSVSAGSSISRCPETVAQDSESIGVTYTSTDRLCLDGQRLIVVSGSYGASGSVYRTELDSGVKVSLVSGDINSTSLPAEFTVQKADGQVAYYGYGSNVAGSSNTVFTASGAPYPLTWAIGREEDTYHNSIIYTYLQFGAGEYLLTNITYTGTGTTPGNRYVAFDYVPRTDISTSFLAGGMTQQTQMLADVRTSSDGSTQVLQYNLQYDTSIATGRTLLAGVQECGYRKAQGSQYPVCLPATTFTWNASTLNFSNPVSTGINDDADSGITHTADITTPPQPSLSAPGDFDGDGRKELLWYRSGVGERVFFLNSDNSIRQSVDVSTLFSDVILHHGDITGDGATDLLGNSNGELGYSSWNGTGFSTPQSLGIPYFYNTYAVDVDGDGKIDVAQNETNPADSSGFIFKVYLNTSVGGNVSFDTTPVAAYTTQSAQYVAPAGDLDGNGLPDFFVTNFNPSGGGVKTQGVLFTTGKPGAPKLTYVPYANMNLDAQAHIGGVSSNTTYQNGYFMDINGDGLPDFVFDCSNGNWCYQLNEGGNGSGTTFGNTVDTNVVDSRPEMGITAALTADIDNDGMEEILYPDQMLDKFCSRDKVNVEGTITTEDECYDSPGINHLPASQNFSIYNYAELKFEPQSDSSGDVLYVPTVRSGTYTNLIGQANLATAGDLGGNGIMDLISPFTKWYVNGEFLQADGSFLSCPEAPYPCGTGVSQNTSESSTNINAAPDMLLSATNGFGVSQYWDYYPLSSSVAFNGNPLYYAPTIGSMERTQDALDGYFYFTSSMYVVGEYRESNGVGGGTNSDDFHYARAIFQSKGRGFQGFKVVADENNATGIRSVQVYHQHFPLSGQLEESWTNLLSAGMDLSDPQAGSNFISDTQYAVDCQRGSTAPAIAGNTFTCKTDLGVDAPTYLPLLKQSIATERDAKTGDVLSITTTAFTYDMFGNTTDTLKTINDVSGSSGTSYTRDVTNVITNDESAWWLGRLDKSTVSSSITYSSDDPSLTMPDTITTYEYDPTSRAVTKKIVLPNDAAHHIETDYGYDSFGNTTTVTVSGGDATAGTAVAARTTTTTYTPDGYFVASVKDPVGLVTSTTPDYTTGNPLTVTAPDGVIKTYSYDPFGRTISTAVSSTSTTLPAEAIAYNTTATGCRPETALAVTTTQAGYPGHTVCEDMLGRTIRSISDGFDASTATYVDTTYDARGRVTQQSVPYFSSDAPQWDTFTYDASIDPLGRLTHKHEAKGVDSSYSYNGLSTTVSVTQTNDNRTRTTTETHNALGKLVSNVDTNGSDTEFRYDAHGNPVYIKDAIGNTITTIYNILDQKTSVDDPDQGNSSFGYDVLGELKTQTDADGNTITQGYDNDGRMTSRSRSDGISASWVYDSCTHGAGKLCSVSQSDRYAEAYTYDDLGRVTNLDNTINGADYNTSTTYDTNGRVQTVTYPELAGVDAMPHADAGPDQSVALPSVVGDSATVNLNGSGSTTPASGLGALRYHWSQVSGPSVTLSGASTATPSFTTDIVGVYVFGLTVNNDVAQGDQDTVTVTVTPAQVTSLSVISTKSTDGTYLGNTQLSTTGSYTLTWTAAINGATSFEYLQSTNGGPYGTPTSANSPDTLYGMGSQTANITYTYEVVGCASGICGPPSDPASIIVELPPGPPASISLPAQSNWDGSFNVGWGAAAGLVSNYHVQIGQWDSEMQRYDWLSAHCGGAPTDRSCSIAAGTLANGIYDGHVYACNDRSCGSDTIASNAITVSIIPAPAAPSLSGTTTTITGSVSVNWSAPTNATNYQLYAQYYSQVSASWGSYTLEYSGTSRSWSQTLTGDQKYAHYYVKACDQAGCSSASNSVTTTYVTPAAPSLSGTTSTLTGNVSLNWTAASGATSYRLYAQYYSQASASWGSYALKYSGTSRSWSQTLTGDQKYAHYYAEACNAPGCSASSNTVTTTYATPAAPTLSAPTNTSNGSVSLSWTAPSGATSYKLDAVYQSRTTGAWGAYSVIYSGSAPAYTDTIGTMKEAASYYVNACNAAGCSGNTAINAKTVTYDLAGGGGGGGGGGCKTCSPKLLSQPAPSTSSTSAPSAASDSSQYAMPAQPTVNPAVTDGGSADSVGNGNPPSDGDTSQGATPPADGGPLTVNRAAADTLSSLRHSGVGQMLTPAKSANAPSMAVDPALESVAIAPSIRRNQNGTRSFTFAPPVYQYYAAAEIKPASTTTTIARFTVAYEYTSTGYLSKVENALNTSEVYWQATATDARGQVNAETFGNGVQSTRKYDPASGYLTDIDSGLNGGTGLQYLHYAWEPLGNLTLRQDNNRNLDESFSYDTLNRLTGGVLTNGSGTTSTSYSYDAIGNIVTKSDTGTYAYGNGAGPHAVTSVTGVNPGTYQYDADGNMTNRNGTTISWNSDNLPTQITQDANNSSTFGYAPDKHRYYQSALVDGVTETTLYLGNMEVVTRNGVTDYRQRISAYGRDVGEYIVSTDASHDQMTYILTDHLGSVDVVTDSSGMPISGTSWSFGAFGNRRDNTTWSGDPTTATVSADRDITNRGFTNQEMLDNVALIHMNGRVYDPNLGRFLSVDPVFQFPTNTQSLNPYSYVLNNPLSLTDPSGYLVACTDNEKVSSCASSLKDGQKTDITDGKGNKIGTVGKDAHGNLLVTGGNGSNFGQKAEFTTSISGNTLTTTNGTVTSQMTLAPNGANLNSGGTNEPKGNNASGSAEQGDQKSLAPLHHRLSVVGTNEFVQQVDEVEQKAIEGGIAMNKGDSSIFGELQNGNRDVFIRQGVTDDIGVLQGQPKGPVIVEWNPGLGTYVRTSAVGQSNLTYQSPALGLIHELGHAYQMSVEGLTGILPEKPVIYGIELQWAKRYNEPIRDINYAHGGIDRPDTSLFDHTVKHW